MASTSSTPLSVPQQAHLAPPGNKGDDRLISKSFGGNPSPLLRKSGFHRHISSDFSHISYSGYLLKRSNLPYQRTDQILAPRKWNPTQVPTVSGLLIPEIPKVECSPTDLDSKADGPMTTPLHASLVIPSPPHRTSPVVDTDPKNHIQMGLEAAAAFFGIALEPDENQQRGDELSPTFDRTLFVPEPSVKVSAPIKVDGGDAAEQEIQRDSFQEALHRRNSAPWVLTPNSDDNTEASPLSRTPPPEDFVDDEDGHLWRAKYCVLEEGILYFYRNQTDGESPEAARERRQVSNLHEDEGINRVMAEDPTDLSRSPLPRSFLHQVDSNQIGESSICMWEKRVFLNCVGAVRSAEQEHGSNSFELRGVNDTDRDDYKVDENTDTLVLKARNQDEMKEWIFQFHRSLASFMRDIVDAVGSAYLDIDHPVLLHPASRIIHNSPSEKQLQRLLSVSPKLNSGPLSLNPLSHGHGRINVRRRRRDLRSIESVSKSDWPDATLSCSKTESHTSGATSISPLVGHSNAAFRMSPDSESSEKFLVLPMNNLELSSREVERKSKGLDERRSASRKYIPPHLRNRAQNRKEDDSCADKYMPPRLREARPREPSETMPNEATLLSLRDRAANPHTQSTLERSPKTSQSFETRAAHEPEHALNVVGAHTISFKKGGCADPQLMQGSILDSLYVPRKASRLSPVPSEAFGAYGGGGIKDFRNGKSSLSWETGAISECGIRDSNEDAYLIAHDLLSSFQSLRQKIPDTAPFWTIDAADHDLGLFAVFDGHCGNEAARFAAEKLPMFIYDEITTMKSAQPEGNGSESSLALCPVAVENVLRHALAKLDDEFCRLCQDGGRQWESGATALVALLVNEHMIVANIGDCRGVLCRYVDDRGIYLGEEQWNELDTVIDDLGQRSSGVSLAGEPKGCFWKEVTKVHNPADVDERNRIEQANGWVTTETEIPIGQLRRMDFLDEDVIGILKRCFSDRYENSGQAVKECKAAPQRILEISRVCGELAVSRALGDRDFKASFNKLSPEEASSTHTDLWDCPLFLPYPENHNRQFRGDLVTKTPDFHRVRVWETGVFDEFLLLACDGLWDVMDADDAVRVTGDLLFRKKWTAKRAAARLAELAVHLGSSDNITVIVVRLYGKRAG